MSPDSTGINDCYILLETAVTRQVIDYAIPDDEGFYRIPIPLGDTSLMKVSVQGLAYATESATFRPDAGQSDHIVNFVLREKTNQLSEITIVGEKLQITLKEDTIVYDVTQFKQEGDKRLIDVLKRIPGLEVNERIGQIKFKGKPIETILLDGDDLFGSSYSLGARNINVELVDQIEAIEDYHDNRLEKGITRSEKVALNLKLKKDAAQISGEVSAGGGLHNYLAHLNSIALLRKLKGFSVLHGNNSSINESPYLLETYSNEHAQEVQNHATNPFAESTVLLAQGSPRSYINDLRYGDLKLLYKPVNKLTLTGHVSAFSDNTDYHYNSTTDFRVQATTVETSNETQNVSQPNRFNLQAEALINVSDSAFIKAGVNVVRNSDEYTQVSLQNGEDFFEIALAADKKYLSQELTYSNKLSARSLLEVRAFRSGDDTRSDFSAIKDPPVVIDGLSYSRQNTYVFRRGLDTEASFLTSFGKFSLRSALAHESQHEEAVINMSENQSAYLFRNKTLAAKTRLHGDPASRLNFYADATAAYSSRDLAASNTIEDMTQQDLYVNAVARILYKASQNSSFSVRGSREKRTPHYRFLVYPKILLDTRNVVTNVPSLNMEEKKSGTFAFSHYNVYRQRNLSFNITGSETTNSYLARQSISEDLFISTWYQTNSPRREASISTSAGVLISPISNRLNLHSGMNVNQFYNAVNENTQKYLMSFYMLGIELNSAFEGRFNYKTSFDFTHIVVEQENTPRFTNSTVSGELEALFRVGSNLFLRFENEVIVPSTGNTENANYFMDIYADYHGQRFDLFLQARNIFARPAISQVVNTEISTSFLSNQSYGRLILLGFGWRF